MTDFTRYRSRTRDIQDSVERGMWGELAYVNGAGASLTIRGTGTVDEEVPLMNLGYGFNLPSNSNAEMVMLSLGSDVNDKVALATLPRDLQHPWGVGEGGVQNPTDPDRRLEFNGDEMWFKDGDFKFGNNKEMSLSVSDGKVTLNIGPDTDFVVPNLKVEGNFSLNGDMQAAGGVFTHNGVDVGYQHKHTPPGGPPAQGSGGSGSSGSSGGSGTGGSTGGTGGSGSSGVFTFTQGTPVMVWTIDHNLGHRPIVSTTDSAGDEIFGTVSHPTDNRTTVTFTIPVDGEATLI